VKRARVMVTTINLRRWAKAQLVSAITRLLPYLSPADRADLIRLLREGPPKKKITCRSGE
jgi:hypothetical protein